VIDYFSATVVGGRRRESGGDVAAGKQTVPKAEQRKVRTKRGIRAYTYLGCPLTRDRSAWCFRLCVPDPQGKGQCGRIAPHGLKGRTQLAIEGHRKQRRSTHFAKLERMYLAAPLNDHYDPGVRVRDGEAEIVVPTPKTLRLPSGDVAESVYLKLMNDAAALAVNAIVEDRLVATVRFNIQLTRHSASGNLIARGLVVAGSGGQYQAECVLADASGREIGRGDGTFEAGRTVLSPEIGYS
jgi:acyl-coenzyme A thioesterase PaaI-like protein